MKAPDKIYLTPRINDETALCALWFNKKQVGENFEYIRKDALLELIKEYEKKVKCSTAYEHLKMLEDKINKDLFRDDTKMVQQSAEFTTNQFDGITYGIEGYSTDKPAAWSEEDKKTIDEAIEYLEKYVTECVQGGNSKVYIFGLASRLNRLKSRHAHWKPSDNVEGLEMKPEFDIEAEIKKWYKEHFQSTKPYEYHSGFYLLKKSILDFANRFYELGRQYK